MNPQKVMEQPFITPGTTVEGVLLHLPLRPVALRFAFFLKFLAAVTAAWLKRPRFFFCEDAMAAWSSRPFVWTTANTRAFFLVARCFLFKEFLSRFLSRFFGNDAGDVHVLLGTWDVCGPVPYVFPPGIETENMKYVYEAPGTDILEPKFTMPPSKRGTFCPGESLVVLPDLQTTVHPLFPNTTR